MRGIYGGLTARVVASIVGLTRRQTIKALKLWQDKVGKAIDERELCRFIHAVEEWRRYQINPDADFINF